MLEGNMIGLGLLVVHLLLFGTIGYAFYRIRKTESQDEPQGDASLGRH
ncbi:hypothetical protein [Acidimangrovimonas sediminis]|nr:hypothetical protein [Acidimangrovimonas sediminis]